MTHLGAPHIRRTDVLGVGVSAVSFAEAVAEVDRLLATGRHSYITVTGVHGVMESQRDDQLKAIHNDAAMAVPDGMPLVWASHRAGANWVERVYGPDLMLAVLERSIGDGRRHFLYGGADGVAELLAERLADRFPGVQIAGTYTPPFRPLTPDEEATVTELVNSSRADIVWVGLGTPKQERWMAEHVDAFDAPLLIGVGAAFDFHAGLVPQAPPWMQERGLEWAYRLTREPKRLWRRYLRNNPAFVAAILRERPRLLA